MHVHTCAHARRRWRCRCRAGSGSGSGSDLGLGLGLGLGLLDSGSDLSLSSLPGLILFDSGSKDPLLLRTCWIANGCAPVGLPKVAHLLDNQRLRNSPLRVNGCDCWAANRHVCWTKGCNLWFGFKPVGPLLESYI